MTQHAAGASGDAGEPARVAGTRDPLAVAAGAAFLLLVVAISGPIAPMGIATALCGALTLACVLRLPDATTGRERRAWPRTPLDRPAIAWFVALEIGRAHV